MKYNVRGRIKFIIKINDGRKWLVLIDELFPYTQMCHEMPSTVTGNIV